MLLGKRDYLPRLQTFLVFLIMNGRAKTKLAILPFLCCGEIMKNSIIHSMEEHAFILHKHEVYAIMHNKA